MLPSTNVTSAPSEATSFTLSARPEGNSKLFANMLTSTVAVKPFPGKTYLPPGFWKSGSAPPSQFAAVENLPFPAPVQTYVASVPTGGRTVKTPGPARPSSAFTSPDAAEE